MCLLEVFLESVFRSITPSMNNNFQSHTDGLFLVQRPDGLTVTHDARESRTKIRWMDYYYKKGRCLHWTMISSVLRELIVGYYDEKCLRTPEILLIR